MWRTRLICWQESSFPAEVHQWSLQKKKVLSGIKPTQHPITSQLLRLSPSGLKRAHLGPVSSPFRKNKILLEDNFPNLHLQGFLLFFLPWLPNSLLLLFTFILQPSLHPTNYPQRKSSRINQALPHARSDLPANTHRAFSCSNILLSPGLSLPVCDCDLLSPSRKHRALPAGNCVLHLYGYAGHNDGPRDAAAMHSSKRQKKGPCLVGRFLISI